LTWMNGKGGRVAQQQGVYYSSLIDLRPSIEELFFLRKHVV